MLGKIEGRRRRGHQRVRWLDGITDAMDMNLDKFQVMVRDRDAVYDVVYGVTKSRLFTSGGQIIGASSSASVLPVNIQG